MTEEEFNELGLSNETKKMLREAQRKEELEYKFRQKQEKIKRNAEIATIVMIPVIIFLVIIAATKPEDGLFSIIALTVIAVICLRAIIRGHNV